MNELEVEVRADSLLAKHIWPIENGDRSMTSTSPGFNKYRTQHCLQKQRLVNIKVNTERFDYLVSSLKLL